MQEVEYCIKSFSGQKHCVIEELNVQENHVDLLILVPPKVFVSELVGMLKGSTAIRVFNKFVPIGVIISGQGVIVSIQ